MPKQKGDHLSHEDWNRVEQAATTPELYNSAGLPSPSMSPALVSLTNATGAAVAEFSVYQVGPSFTRDGAEFVKGIWKEGVTLDGYAVTDATAPFAISQQPLNANRVGTGIVNGVTACKVSGSGPYAAPVVGQTYLQACECGPARVIFRNSGSGPQWAVVSLCQHLCGGGGSHGLWVFACLDEDLTPEESVTAKTWPDGDEITVYAPPLLCEEEDIPACSMVLALYQPQDGKYYAVIYGGTCHCECGSEPYPEGYSVYAWLGVTDDYILESPCSGAGNYAAWPQDLYLECYQNNNRPQNPGNSKNKKYLGIVATYADYATCAAAMNALNGQSQLLETILPSNDMTWFEAFINEGYRSSSTAAGATMATAAEIKGCQDMVESFACNTDCSTCQPQTCSECSQQKTPGTMHAEIEVRIKISHAGTVTTLPHFFTCRNWPMGTIDGSGCCKNSTCFD